MLDASLKIFARIWIVLVAMLNVAEVAAILLTAKSLQAGWLRIQDIYSPFTISTYIVNLVLLAPALGAEYWRAKRKSRKGESGASV